MASLKELRDRIGSVKNTQKITRAMQMVAAAKLRRAQEAAQAARPYGNSVSSLFKLVVSQVEGLDSACGLVKGTGKDKVNLLVVCTADRGLCGGFNSQIVKRAIASIKALQAAGKVVKILTIGRKGAEILSRDYGDLIIDRISFKEVKTISYLQAQQISKLILSLFERGEFDVCTLFYSEFRSVLLQEPQAQQLIPAPVATSDIGDSSAVAGNSAVASNSIYEYEPDAIGILNNLAKQRIVAEIFKALLENVAGEMGAKMRAMDNATRNAGEMIKQLSVTYNRRRQAQITTELIEIIAGAEAL